VEGGGLGGPPSELGAVQFQAVGAGEIHVSMHESAISQPWAQAQSPACIVAHGNYNSMSDLCINVFIQSNSDCSHKRYGFHGQRQS
jgi:hypothetical protein